MLIEYILHAIARPKDLAGLRIAVTAGPTQEPLDPVRYLTNHSTGKMGYALAPCRRHARRGCHPYPRRDCPAAGQVYHRCAVTTAQQMYEAVTSRFDATDVLIMAAAVADYRPAAVANDKIKKRTATCPSLWNARRIFWAPSAPKRPTSSCAVFP